LLPITKNAPFGPKIGSYSSEYLSSRCSPSMHVKIQTIFLVDFHSQFQERPLCLLASKDFAKQLSLVSLEPSYMYNCTVQALQREIMFNSTMTNTVQYCTTLTNCTKTIHNWYKCRKEQTHAKGKHFVEDLNDPAELH